ncbi:MAG: CvpA family protein [Pseudomonadota bacterium]|nr:CvpA family protein [Pseudomonadota bacterium]
MMIMTTFDWLMLIVLVASIALAVRRGLLYEALSVFTWVLVFFLAMLIAPDLANALSLGYGSQQEHYAASFVLIIIASLLIGTLYAFTLINGPTKARTTGRALSCFLGLVRGLILLLATTVVITMTGLKYKDWWLNSSGAYALVRTLHGIKPVLPDRFARKMD